MMPPDAERFPYIAADPTQGSSHDMPYVPIVLPHGKRRVATNGLVDSGSTLNVLPYRLGLQLGAVWERQSVLVPLTGILSDSEARAILISGRIGRFPPVRLVFAWTQNERVPLILGQVNFFREFDVFIFGARLAFEIRPKGQEE